MSSAPGGAKLDQSLDDILKTRRDNRPRGGKRARRGKKDGAPAAPVGGVKKATKPAKAAKPVPTGPSSNGDHKIIVSNLPPDVDEAQIKEYFNKTIGNLKKVMLTYGPDGRSRGICTLTFTKSHAALEAAKSLDGVKIDQRPMRVEVLVSAKDAPAAPMPKSLAERMSQPKKEKPQPKPATNTKAGAGRGRGNKRGRGGRAGARLPKKTVEELDAEMADYFVPAPPANGEAMQTNGNPASGGDTGMVVDDEMI